MTLEADLKSQNTRQLNSRKFTLFFITVHPASTRPVFLPSLKPLKEFQQIVYRISNTIVSSII